MKKTNIEHRNQLLAETVELIRIFVASIRTAENRATKRATQRR